MPEIRPNPRTQARNLIDFQRVVDAIATGESWLICMPIALVFIIRKLLSERGLWRTTYVIGQYEQYYEIPTEAEFSSVRELINEFLEETTAMRCDDFINALRDISASIRAASCCSPGSSTGYVEDGSGGVWYGTEEPLPKPDTFGTGQEFETEAEFLEHLCSAANNIVAGLILSLNSWSALSLASLIAGALVVAFFVATPPLGVFLALAAAGFLFGTLHTMANYIDTNRQGWVCAIYNSTDYADMLVKVDELIGTLVIDLSIGPFEVQITELIHGMLSTDVINKAYRNIGLPDVISPVDCDLCFVPPCPRWGIAWGEVDGDPEYLVLDTEYTIRPQDGDASYQLEIQLEIADCGCTDYEINISSYGNLRTDVGNIVKCDASASWTWNIEGWGAYAGAHLGVSFYVRGVDSTGYVTFTITEVSSW